MSSAASPLIAVYADESCLGNGQGRATPGAAGGLIELQHQGTLRRFEYWVAEPDTTNNRMALRSAIEALRLLAAKGRRCRVVFVSDSRYLIDGNASWLYGWMKKGWKRTGGPIENLELWQELVAARAAHDVDWRWVKGHAGQIQNEYANFLATRAAAQQTQSGGIRPAAFDAWLAAERAKGRMTATEYPFPDAAGFRAAPPLPPVGSAVGSPVAARTGGR